MKRLFSALAVALCMMLSAEANNIIEINTNSTDAHICGHVIDKNTGEHLPYIVVMLKGTTIGVATENTGHYMISIKKGTVSDGEKSSGNEHMDSFNYAYKLSAVRNWLFEQSK